MKVFKAYRAPLYAAHLKANCKKLVYNEVAYKTEIITEEMLQWKKLYLKLYQEISGLEA